MPKTTARMPPSPALRVDGVDRIGIVLCRENPAVDKGSKVIAI